MGLCNKDNWANPYGDDDFEEQSDDIDFIISLFSVLNSCD